MSQKLPHSEFQVIALYLESIIEATHLLVGIRERKWGMIITKRKRKMEPTGYDGFWYWRPSSILLQGLTTENKETSSQVRTQPSALWKAKSLLDPLLSTVGGHGLRLTLEWRFPILFLLFWGDVVLYSRHRAFHSMIEWKDAGELSYLLLQ